MFCDRRIVVWVINFFLWLRLDFCVRDLRAFVLDLFRFGRFHCVRVYVSDSFVG